MQDISELHSVAYSGARDATFGGLPKRLLDIFLSCSLLIALAPLILLVACMITMADGHSAIIRHQRVGRFGRPFACLKFRTMVPDADQRLALHLARDPAARAEWERDRKLKNDPRVTPLGRVFRKLSVDELPQLLNVIRGEMSLVGPRPMVHDEIVRCGAAAAEVLQAPPGLTGLWQIKGRNELPFEARIALNKQYVRNQTFLYDCRILLLTIPVVLSRRGSC
jgi:lipopolysaccharide/colanic/teichoic acid biosynthesis glycosyltransferase